MSLTAILAFIVVFALLVSFHEFGHFIVAKKTGVLVREFAIGMGPKLFSWYRNSTSYTIRLLPVGGYVRMASEEDHAELVAGQQVYLEQDPDGLVVNIDCQADREEAGFLFQIDQADLVDGLVLTGYRNGSNVMETLFVAPTALIIDDSGQETRIAPRSSWIESASALKRLAINLAGPVMNFVLALLAAMVLAFSLGQVSTNTPVLGQVVAHQPAAEAGLKANDRILSVDGHSVKTFTDFASRVNKAGQSALFISYQRSGVTKSVKVTPEAVAVSGQKTYRIGVVAKEETGFTNRLQYGLTMTGSWFTQVGRGILDLFTSTFSLNKLGGPVMLAKATSTASNQGFLTVLVLLGFLSVNLGLINLLPIPPLDGGKVFLDLYETIFRHPFPKALANGIIMVGTVALLILMVLVTAKDLLQF